MTTARLRADSSESPVDAFLLGPSAAMTDVRQLVRRVAPAATSVLVTGPSGSGKECVARAIHATSARASGPFIAVNCGAIPRDLLESDLFGHEKGSFTGAHALRRGRFEQAHRGTLFLDEIGDMPPDMQVKLLRVIEERTVERVGGTKALSVDVRIISATHRDLSAAISEQRFREDLFYRLAVFPIHLPPLAARTDDLSVLIRHFIAQAADRAGSVRFTSAARARLATHNWPGNVRELRNLVERAAILHPGALLGADDVEALLLPNKPGVATKTSPPSHGEIATSGMDLRATLHDLEGRYITEALNRANGVVADAARLLGLQRTTLIEKMRRHS